MQKAQEVGKSTTIQDKYGNIYDHFAISYQWENGTSGYHFSRQQNGTAGSYELELYGSKGFCSAKNRHLIDAGDNSWRYRGENNDMYQSEHDELFASIRNGKAFNDGERAAHSTMVAILGQNGSLHRAKNQLPRCSKFKGISSSSGI